MLQAIRIILDFAIPFNRLRSTERSVVDRGTSVWKSLLESIRFSPFVSTSKRRLKLHILKTYMNSLKRKLNVSFALIILLRTHCPNQYSP